MDLVFQVIFPLATYLQVRFWKKYKTRKGTGSFPVNLQLTCKLDFGEGCPR